MSTDQPEITVITPGYNEEESAEKSLTDLTAVLESIGKSWELIYIDDGSKDGTADRVRAFIRKEPRVQLVSYPVNRGRGYALRQGFSASKGKWVISTEADLSWGAEIIRKLYDALQEPMTDFVIASPYRAGGALVGVPFKRAFLSRFGNVLLRMAVGGGLTMVSGMTRGYRGEAIRSLSLESDRKEIHLEIASKLLSLGYRASEISATLTWTRPPASAKPKSGVATSASKMKLRQTIWSHLNFCLDEKPFLLIGTAGLLLLLVGLILGAWAIVLWLQGPMAGRPILLASLLLILFGFHAMVSSLLANQNRDLRKQIIRLQRDVSKIRSDGKS